MLKNGNLILSGDAVHAAQAHCFRFNPLTDKHGSLSAAGTRAIILQPVKRQEV